MTEYIKRAAVFEQFYNGEADVIEVYPDGSVDFGFGASNIRDLINAIPAADVAPVVYCLECKRSGLTEFGKRYCSEPMGAFAGCIPVEDDSFCSGGKRREDAHAQD